MYKRTIWQDHVEGIQDGTDMNAANFNNIEAGVMENAALAALNSAYQRYGYDMAKNAEVLRIAAILRNSGEINKINIPQMYKRNTNSYNVSFEILETYVGDAGELDAGDIFITKKEKDYFEAKYSGTAGCVYVCFHVSGGMF